MRLFSGPFRTEAQRRDGRILPVLQVSWPSGTERYAVAGYPSSMGAFSPRVLSWGTIKRSVSIRSSGLGAVDTSVDLADTDRHIAGLVTGSYGRSLRRSACKIMLASPNVPEDDWHVVFAGIVEGHSFPAPLRCRLTLRTDDRALRKDLVLPIVNELDYPNADSSAQDEIIPVLYGKLSSQGMSSKGMVPLLATDTTNQYHTLCVGWAYSVDRVYRSDGTLISSGNYTVAHPIRAGYLCTEVQITSGTPGTGLLADVQGYGSVGDGTGALISNPAQQMRHFLRNFVYTRYQRGVWDAAHSSAPIAWRTWQACAEWMTRRSLEGSKRISTTVSGLDMLTEWAESWGVKVYWTRDGKLAARPLNLTKPLRYKDYRWLRWETADSDGLDIRYDSERAANRVRVEFVYSEAEGRYYRKLTCLDPSVDDDGVESIQMPWGPGRVT